jgi:hypothetical protein
MTRTTHTHGARWLAKLISLGQLVIAVLVAASAGWLLVTFPVWFADAPRIPLPVEVGISPDHEILTLEEGTSPFREFTFDRISGDLKVKFEGAWTQWLFVFFALQEFVLVLLILMFLQKIVASIATGEAFSAVNAKRLRWVGVLMIIEAIFGPGASAMISGLVIKNLQTVGGEVTVNWFRDFAQGGFFTGWIILILSEVFRQGAEMKQDQSLTI